MKAFAVYLAGDEIPSAVFPWDDDSSKAKTSAKAYCADFPRWCDKTIQEIEVPNDFLWRKPNDLSASDNDGRVPASGEGKQ